MSQEKVLETLKNLGLTQPDARVYVFLGKKGPQKAMEIAKSLNLPKQTLYRAIKNLESKGIITASLERPAKFSVVPFEKVLDLFVKSKTDEVHRIKQDKKGLLADWQSIAITETVNQSPRFAVIEGRNYIYPRLKQMIGETKKEILIISNVSGLLRAEQSGLLEAAFQHALKTNISIKFLAEVSEDNKKSMNMILEKIPKGAKNFQGRTPELGLKLISRMIIRDNEEAAFFVSKGEDKHEKETDDLCLWTNSSSIVNSFTAVFENLWHNSVNIEDKIVEIEKGVPISKTIVISDPLAAKMKYNEAIAATKKEILIITSPSGLIEVSKNILQLKEITEKGVSIKIMAPIIRDNLDAALKLSGNCKVKHVPSTYLGTTIVDGNHLFQFKNRQLDEFRSGNSVNFENMIYTNERDILEKTKNMLDEIWRNAISPSAITIEQITRPPILIDAPVRDDEYVVSRKDSPYQQMAIGVKEKPGLITEEYVLNKIFNAKRNPNLTRRYGNSASAVIHSPNNLNLPDMLLTVFHCNKQSSFGAEDHLIVYLWLETQKGFAYVPVAIAGDNSKSLKSLKNSYSGTPASKNINLLKKDELQIQVYGNTLFAGWTVFIPLFPSEYILPPASMLVEGYGKIKTVEITFTMPSGVNSILEGNGLDAFVTFFLPESKYSGPGTDGIFARDYVLATEYP